MSRTRSFINAALAFTIVCMALMSGRSWADGTAAVVYLVRHAEKTHAGRDPELSEAGRQRAAELADLLRDAGIGQIYSTDFIRTRETVSPLAERLGLETRLYDWNDRDQLAASLNRAGARSLVVGHSNTTTELVELLGGEAGGEIDEPEEYDRLYILTISRPEEVETVLIRYGKPYHPQ